MRPFGTRPLSWRLAFPALLALLAVLPLHQVLAEQGDIVFTREKDESNEYPPATFPHAVHRYQYKCYVCHDDIFKMKKGTNKVTMDDIGSGKFCGTCHNDTIAFGSTFESCQRCHLQ